MANERAQQIIAAIEAGEDLATAAASASVATGHDRADRCCFSARTVRRRSSSHAGRCLRSNESQTAETAIGRDGTRNGVRAATMRSTSLTAVRCRAVPEAIPLEERDAKCKLQITDTIRYRKIMWRLFMHLRNDMPTSIIRARTRWPPTDLFQ